MDGMTNGDGMQIVMLLYDVDGFSDEEPFIFVWLWGEEWEMCQMWGRDDGTWCAEKRLKMWGLTVSEVIGLNIRIYLIR